jgi:hypothetical protein
MALENFALNSRRGNGPLGSCKAKFRMLGLRLDRSKQDHEAKTPASLSEAGIERLADGLIWETRTVSGLL